MYLMNRTDICPADCEQLFFYAPTASLQISMPKVIEQIHAKRITKTDLDIIKFLFEFRMATEEQLSLLYGDENHALHNSLNNLVKSRILNKFCLASGERLYNEEALTVYCIDKGGAELLRYTKNGEAYNLFRIEDIILPALSVLKHLTNVDFYIRLLESCPNKLRVYQPNPLVLLGKIQIIPHFGFAIEHNEELKYFVGDVIFASDVSSLASKSERFVEKAIQLEYLLCTNVYKKNFGQEKPPTLLLIAEDDETMFRAAETISTTDIPNRTPYRVTTVERLKQDLSKEEVFFAYDTNTEKLTSSQNNIFIENN